MELVSHYVNKSNLTQKVYVFRDEHDGGMNFICSSYEEDGDKYNMKDIKYYSKKPILPDFSSKGFLYKYQTHSITPIVIESLPSPNYEWHTFDHLKKGEKYTVLYWNTEDDTVSKAVLHYSHIYAGTIYFTLPGDDYLYTFTDQDYIGAIPY